jgi:hypothetical protein
MKNLETKGELESSKETGWSPGGSLSGWSTTETKLSKWTWTSWRRSALCSQTSLFGFITFLLGNDCVGIDQAAVFTLFDGAGHIDSVLLLHKCDELVRILADNDGSIMAGNVVPLDTIIVLVVHRGEASLVVEFLKTFNGHTNVEFGINGALLDAFIIVWLRSSRSRNRFN